MNKKKNILTGFAFFLASLLLFIAVFNILIPKSDQELTKKDFLAQKTKSFRYVAIGDSLTEGVGDTTNQGGFVPILSQSLTDTYHYQVTHDNYGVSGNTSNQILTRMKDKQDIQNSLAKADMMTLTVGGNDVMAVIRKHLTKLSVATFKKPAKSYQERLRQIIELARSENEDLPIYILGIYNPFYLNFPEMTEMQEIINDWNDATESVTEEYDNVYFVPINDQLYKGIDGQEGIVSTSGDQTTVINDALFSGDHFHPNNIGYQIMSDVTMEKINETKKNGTKTNWWKWACLLILAINIAFVGVIASRLIQVREPAAQSVSTKKVKSVKVGTISTTREELNDTIAAYLKEYQTKNSSYNVYATSSAIMFEGTYTFLGYEVPLYIYFQPSRLESGAIQLKITSFSVGTLTLPESEVLKYLKSSVDLPDFVEILPKESVININIQNIKNDAGIFLKATTIDLVGDQFNFDIYKKNS